MVAAELPATSTGFRVLAAMLRHRDHGIEGLDRYALSECTKKGRSTVHAVLRDFIRAGWVTADQSVCPETGGPCPTICRLTDSAPSLDELLGIEAKA